MSDYTPVLFKSVWGLEWPICSSAYLSFVSFVINYWLLNARFDSYSVRPSWNMLRGRAYIRPFLFEFESKRLIRFERKRPIRKSLTQGWKWIQSDVVRVNVKVVNGTPSHSYGVSLAIWDHTVLPATQHKWTHPALTPATWLVLALPTPEGWKAAKLFADDVKLCKLFMGQLLDLQIENVDNTVQESWAIAKMTTRCALCVNALEIFGSL